MEKWIESSVAFYTFVYHCLDPSMLHPSTRARFLHFINLIFYLFFLGREIARFRCILIVNRYY